MSREDPMQDWDLDGELERRLRAFVDARLEPSAGAVVRMREATIAALASARASAPREDSTAQHGVLIDLAVLDLEALRTIVTGPAAESSTSPPLSSPRRLSAPIPMRHVVHAHRSSRIDGASNFSRPPHADRLAPPDLGTIWASGGHGTNGRRGVPRRSTRAAAVLLAAALGVGGSAAAVLAATPGSALYGIRLWLETLTLPPTADARSAAEVAHLDQRVAEARGAASGGDPLGVAAALDAYRAEVDAALRDAGDDFDRLQRLQAALGTHVASLEALAQQVPADARPAVDAAIDASHTAVDQISSKASPAPSRVPATPAPIRGSHP